MSSGKEFILSSFKYRYCEAVFPFGRNSDRVPGIGVYFEEAFSIFRQVMNKCKRNANRLRIFTIAT